jgi:hypothetical protein
MTLVFSVRRLAGPYGLLARKRQNDLGFGLPRSFCAAFARSRPWFSEYLLFALLNVGYPATRRGRWAKQVIGMPPRSGFCPLLLGNGGNDMLDAAIIRLALLQYQMTEPRKRMRGKKTSGLIAQVASRILTSQNIGWLCRAPIRH